MTKDWEGPAHREPGDLPRQGIGRIDLKAVAMQAVMVFPRAVIAALLIFALMLALHVFVPTRYAAKAVMVIDPRLNASSADKVTPGIGSDTSALDSLTEIALTDAFLLGIVKSEKLDADPDFAARGGDIAVVSKLRSRLTVDRVGSTYVFEVVARAKDPDKAASIANALAEAIVARVRQDRGLVSGEAAKALEAQVNKLRDAVATSETAAAAYRAKLGIVEAGRDANVAERAYSDLSRQVADAGSALEAARSRLEILTQANGAASGALDAIGSPLLTGLRARQSDLQQQLAEQEGIFGPRHPQYTRTRDRLNETNQLLASETRRLLTVARSDYDVALRRHDNLRGQLAIAEKSVSGLDTASAGLSSLELKAKADRDAYEAALSRLTRASNEGGSAEQEMRVTSPAMAPLEPTKKTLGFMAPVAAIAAFPLGFLAMLAIALSKSVVRRSDEVETLTDLPVVGTITGSAWSRRWPARLVMPETSLDTCVSLLIEAARRRPGAIVLIAGASASADSQAAARMLSESLTAHGITSATHRLDPTLPVSRGGLRRSALKAVGRDGLLLISASGDPQEAENLQAAAELVDVVVLLVPWSALSARQLTVAAKRLAPNPGTPAMAMFAV